MVRQITVNRPDLQPLADQVNRCLEHEEHHRSGNAVCPDGILHIFGALLSRPDTRDCTHPNLYFNGTYHRCDDCSSAVYVPEPIPD